MEMCLECPEARSSLAKKIIILYSESLLYRESSCELGDRDLHMTPRACAAYLVQRVFPPQKFPLLIAAHIAWSQALPARPFGQLLARRHSSCALQSLSIPSTPAPEAGAHSSPGLQRPRCRPQYLP